MLSTPPSAAAASVCTMFLNLQRLVFSPMFLAQATSVRLIKLSATGVYS